MNIALNIPYEQKDEFHAVGGRWDRNCKTWYIPDGVKLTLFEKWLSPFNQIIKRPCYAAVSTRSCWKCGADIPLIAIAAEHILQRDEETGVWAFLEDDDLMLFSNILKLPGAILRPLQERYPFFKKAYSATARQSYIGNTCTHCGALQGDFFNHCEPGGAFFPMSEEEAQQIRLIELPFAYDFVIDASCGWSEFIGEYSPRE